MKQQQKKMNRKRQTTPPWITSIFVRHSKKHEKTNSFLDEVNYHGFTHP